MDIKISYHILLIMLQVSIGANGLILSTLDISVFVVKGQKDTTTLALSSEKSIPSDTWQ